MLIHRSLSEINCTKIDHIHFLYILEKVLHSSPVDLTESDVSTKKQFSGNSLILLSLTWSREVEKMNIWLYWVHTSEQKSEILLELSSRTWLVDHTTFIHMEYCWKNSKVSKIVIKKMRNQLLLETHLFMSGPFRNELVQEEMDSTAPHGHIILLWMSLKILMLDWSDPW